MNPLSPSESTVRPYRVPASKEGRGLGSGSNRVQERMDSEPTAVYEIFNRADERIYVGVSRRPTRRMLQHMTDKSWHREIARIEVTWLESRCMALNFEQYVIRMTSPRYNTVHKPRRPFEPPKEVPCPTCRRPSLVAGFSWRTNDDLIVYHWCEDCESQWSTEESRR